MDFQAMNLDIAIFVVSDTVIGFAFAALLYFIGKKLGGNKDWKKIFSVIFHAYIHTVPFLVVISILLFLMLNSVSGIDPSFFQTSDENDVRLFSVAAPVLGYIGNDCCSCSWICCVGSSNLHQGCKDTQWV